MSPTFHRCLLAIAAAFAAAPACWAQPCINTGTPFQVAYAQQANFGTDIVTYDVKVHRYRFVPRVNMTLCSIGYTSPVPSPQKYRMKLRDVTGTPVVLLNLVYNPASAFFPPAPIGTTTYQQNFTPVPLTAGRTYELSRTAILTNGGSLVEYVGRLLTNQAGQFPIAAPDMLIVSSKLYGDGGPSVNQLLPFIDFGTY
jgi:hypothetical protein